MYTKKRIWIPVLSGLVILAALLSGIWFWYDNNVDRSGWKEKDGIRYYRDFHADPVSGWLTLEDGTYFFEEGGIPYTGWLESETQTYFFDETGILTTGWKELDGSVYYFDSQGVMQTGWMELDGNRHYFAGNGTMVTEWLWLEEGQYYLPEGILVTGWQTMEEGIRYFGEDGIMVSGFVQIEENTFYFDSDGIMATGMVSIENAFYDFQDNGIMYTGWQETDAGKRFFNENGVMAVGWQEINGERLFFTNDGYQAQIGWMQDGEYRYYIHEDGSYAVGPTVIDGKTHYFSPKGIEVILVNGANPVPEYFEQNLVTIEEKHKVDARCYDALVQMLSDCKTAGIEYDFNSGHRTMNVQINILEYRTLEHMRDYNLTFAEAREKALDTVAIPGTSEHHLGLAVDLLGKDAIAWLTEHCWEYGFIVRYTQDKESITGIVDEPWHFRYVGREVSLDMKDTGLCLEEYLGAPAVTQQLINTVHGDKWLREEYYIVTEDQRQQILNGKKVG